MASPRRRRPQLHRVRRQRMSQEGMLVQVDGSVHAWLEERGPRCTLLLAIDDATSTVPYALFRHEEDTHGYFLLMQELIRRCGVPLALYSDRHAVFKYVPGSHQSPAPTQFGRAMAELGVGADLRAFSGGEGSGRTGQRHLPGSAGDRTTSGWGQNHLRGQPSPVGFLDPLQTSASGCHQHSPPTHIALQIRT